MKSNCHKRLKTRRRKRVVYRRPSSRRGKLGHLSFARDSGMNRLNFIIQDTKSMMKCRKSSSIGGSELEWQSAWLNCDIER